MNHLLKEKKERILEEVVRKLAGLLGIPYMIINLST